MDRRADLELRQHDTETQSSSPSTLQDILDYRHYSHYSPFQTPETSPKSSPAVSRPATPLPNPFPPHHSTSPPRASGTDDISTKSWHSWRWFKWYSLRSESNSARDTERKPTSHTVLDENCVVRAAPEPLFAMETEPGAAVSSGVDFEHPSLLTHQKVELPGRFKSDSNAEKTDSST